MAFFNVTPTEKVDTLTETFDRGFNTTVREEDATPKMFEGDMLGALGSGVASGFNRSKYNLFSDSDEGKLRKKEIADSLAKMRPDPKTIGSAGQLMFGIAEPLAFIGTQFLQDPIASILSPSSLAMGVTRDFEPAQTALNIKDGMDPKTAADTARTTSIAMGAGTMLPVSVAGNLATRIISGGLLNVAVGAGERAENGRILRAAGYEDMARQYSALDGNAALAEFVLGGVFGGAFGARVRAPVRANPDAVLPSHIDAALAANQSVNATVDLAPGIPTNGKSAQAHSAALDSAIESLAFGEKVNVESLLTEAGFLGKRPDFNATAIIREELERAGFNDVAAKVRELEAAAQSRGLYVEPSDLNVVLSDAPADIKVGGVRGREASVKIGNDYVPVEYRLMEASDVTATMGKADNQYRDRTRVASEQQINEAAANLDPRLLGESPVMDFGAPIMTADGKIIAGNGRTAFINRAYEANAGSAYIEYLKEQSQALGLSASEIDGMSRPVLVRVLKRDVDVNKAAILSNEGGAMGMSALEQAKVDGERLGNFGAFQFGEDGSVSNVANMPFIRSWVEKFPTNQISRLMDADGRLSAEGNRRLQNAIMYRAYGDSATLSRLIEATDPGSRNIVAALTKTAARVADAKEAIARGEMYPLDLSEDLLSAVEKVASLRDSGMKVNDWINQLDAFGDGMTGEARALVVMMDRNIRSARAIADAIDGYYSRLEALGSPSQGSMFEAATPTKQDVFAPMLDATEVMYSRGGIQFREEMRNYYDGQSDLTLNAEVNGENVGRIDYSVYDGKPQIQMIEITEGFKRKGYATQLLQQLQRQFPDTEIDFGMLTEDGANLYKSLKFIEAPVPEVIAAKARMIEIENRINGIQKAADDFDKIENPTDADRDRLISESNEWNDLRDELEMLQENYGSESSVKRIIDTGEVMYSREGSFSAMYEKITTEFLRDTGFADNILPNGKVLIYHGTSQKNADSILKSGKFKGNPFFSPDEAVAKQYSRQAGKNPVVLPLIVDPGAILPTGGYLSSRAEGLKLQDDGSWSLDESNPMYSRAQTQTPEFKAWFGDSKVVDENGKPLVVYHGTSGDFEAFSQGKAGAATGAENSYLGFFFSDKPGIAGAYANMSQGMNPNGARNIVPTYLSMKNPLRINADDMISADKLLMRNLKPQNDGAIIKVGDNQQTVYMVRTPTQIKSSVGNSGAFDPNDPRINYSRTSGTRSTVSDLTSTFQAQFGRDAGKLIESARVKIVQSVTDLPARSDATPHPADVGGMYDPRDGTTYIVADNTAPSQIRGRILHEIGVHAGFETMLGDTMYADVLAQVDAKISSGDARFIEARRLAEQNAARPEHVAQETLAYLVENAPEIPMARRILAAVRQWLYRVTGGRFVDLGVNDLVQMASASLRRQARIDGVALGNDMPMYQISPERVRELQYETKIPDSPEFREAVANTEGAEITSDGLLIDLIRYQKEEQDGAQSNRTGVFYLPKGSSNVKHYKTGKTGYGGTSKQEGETLLKAPLFVKGATGGKAPEAAYDAIMGKGAYQAMRTDVLSSMGGFGRRTDPNRIGEIMDRYGADSDLAYLIVDTSKEGNTLPYAVQENIVAHAVREAGYDSVVGYSKGKTGLSISEVFDVRETSYPARGYDSEIHPDFSLYSRAQETEDFYRNAGNSDTISTNDNPLITTMIPTGDIMEPIGLATAKADAEIASANQMQSGFISAIECALVAGE